jgi:hypothetical protein
MARFLFQNQKKDLQKAGSQLNEIADNLCSEDQNSIIPI